MTISAETGIWTIGDNWPWPQMVFTKYYNLAFAIKSNGKLALYELLNEANTWIAFEKKTLGNVANIKSVSVADFQTYYVVTVEEYINNNADHGIYYKELSTGNVVEFPSPFPASASCCNFNGQLILGGLHSVHSPWQEITNCSVAWSDIGSVEMNPEEYVVAGFAQMEWDENGHGKVYKVLSLGNVVRVYGDRGNCILTPYELGSSVGFGISEVEAPGILSADSVDGDESIHVFVDCNYDFWVITKEEDKNLGYREFMKTLTNRIIVRYDTYNKRFYISDGLLCYVYTKYGMYSTNQCVSSIGNYKDTLCGFFKDNNDAKIRFTTTSFDFGHQSMKTIESVETGMVYNTTLDLEISGALSVKYDYVKDFTQLPWTNINERGIFTQKVTGREFKIHLQGDYESGAIFSLNSLIPKIKFSDKRNIRGRLNVS